MSTAYLLYARLFKLHQQMGLSCLSLLDLLSVLHEPTAKPFLNVLSKPTAPKEGAASAWLEQPRLCR